MSHKTTSKAALHTYYCPDCGCDEIYFDGQVLLDPETQTWILLEVHSQPWCRDCEDTIYEAKFGDPAEIQSTNAQEEGHEPEEEQATDPEGGAPDRI